MANKCDCLLGSIYKFNAVVRNKCVCGICVHSRASAGALRARTVCRYVPDTCASSHVGARVRVSSCVRPHCSQLSSNRGSMLKPSVCLEIVREGEDVSWYCRFSQILPATAHYSASGAVCLLSRRVLFILHLGIDQTAGGTVAQVPAG